MAQEGRPLLLSPSRCCDDYIEVVKSDPVREGEQKKKAFSTMIYCAALIRNVDSAWESFTSADGLASVRLMEMFQSRNR